MRVAGLLGGYVLHGVFGMPPLETTPDALGPRGGRGMMDHGDNRDAGDSGAVGGFSS